MIVAIKAIKEVLTDFSQIHLEIILYSPDQLNNQLTDLVGLVAYWVSSHFHSSF